jgi:NAD(P)-dependent dehydrogenase (short-subunit alcohol dehydrogenase family)
MSNQRVALITGASSGVGQATARLLSQRGYSLGTSRNSASAASSPGVEMLSLDVRADDSMQACVEAVHRRCGYLDVLINNARYEQAGAQEELSPQARSASEPRRDGRRYLVKTNTRTRSATACSSRLSVPARLVATKSWPECVATCGLCSVAVCRTTSTPRRHLRTTSRSVIDPTVWVERGRSDVECDRFVALVSRMHVEETNYENGTRLRIKRVRIGGCDSEGCRSVY